jgi:hypothetical protein
VSGFKNIKKGRDFYAPALLVAGYAKTSSTLRSCWSLRVQSLDALYCGVGFLEQIAGILGADAAGCLQLIDLDREVAQLLDGVGSLANTLL